MAAAGYAILSSSTLRARSASAHKSSNDDHEFGQPDIKFKLTQPHLIDAADLGRDPHSSSNQEEGGHLCKSLGHFLLVKETPCRDPVTYGDISNLRSTRNPERYVQWVMTFGVSISQSTVKRSIPLPSRHSLPIYR